MSPVLAASPIRVLVVRDGVRAWAIPLESVVETMRPLPMEPVTGTFDYVAGVSIIRGVPTPVLDLDALSSGTKASASFGRVVTLRLGGRPIALGIDSVVGVRDLDAAEFRELPPLLRDVTADRIEAMGARDAELLHLLRTSRLVDETVLSALASAVEALR